MSNNNDIFAGLSPIELLELANNAQQVAIKQLAANELDQEGTAAVAKAARDANRIAHASMLIASFKAESAKMYQREELGNIPNWLHETLKIPMAKARKLCAHARQLLAPKLPRMHFGMDLGDELDKQGWIRAEREAGTHVLELIIDMEVDVDTCIQVLSQAKKVRRSWRNNAFFGPNHFAVEVLREIAESSAPMVREILIKRLSEANLGRLQSRDDLHKQRFLSVRPQRDGQGVRISGFLTNDQAAIVEAALQGLATNLRQADIAKGDTPRGIGHARADALVQLAQVNAHEVEQKTGHPAVMVVLTAEELANMDSSTVVFSTTGTPLFPDDLKALLEESTDTYIAYDRKTSLNLVRCERLATPDQRIALAARQRTCCWEGCEHPVRSTQVHHVKSWSEGGNTDIGNLIALCATHHRIVESRIKKGLPPFPAPRVPPNQG